jgi:hypothetical protein
VGTYYDYKTTIGKRQGNYEEFVPPLNLQALKYGGVRYIVSNKPNVTLVAPAPGLHQVYADDRCTIFEQQALPRSFLLQARSLDEVRSKLDRLRNDINAVSIIPVRPLRKLVNGGGEWSLDIPDGDQGTYLISLESFMPGWTGYVDSDRIAMQNANGWRALPVPAGRHTVYTRYEPASVRIGFAVSALALIVWTTLFLLSLSPCKSHDSQS